MDGTCDTKLGTEPPARLVYRLPEVGELLGGLTRRTVFRLIAEGELETVLIGQTRMVPRASIEAYIERQLTKSRGLQAA